MKQRKNPAAQELAAKSWAKRKIQGQDSKYFSELAKRSWIKRRAKLDAQA